MVFVGVSSAETNYPTEQKPKLNLKNVLIYKQKLEGLMLPKF